MHFKPLAAIAIPVVMAADPICHTKPSTASTSTAQYSWGSPDIPFPNDEIKAEIGATWKTCTPLSTFKVNVVTWAGSPESDSVWTGTLSLEGGGTTGGSGFCTAAVPEYSVWKDSASGTWKWQKTCA